MARVTVEDCLDHVDNRFDLVLKAAKRARDLQLGAADAMVPLEEDKSTVLALREIAEGFDVAAKPSSSADAVDIDDEIMQAVEMFDFANNEETASDTASQADVINSQPLVEPQFVVEAHEPSTQEPPADE